MGEADDPQKIKRIGAAAYDYDGDPRWAEYWENVLIPPRLASSSDVVDHFKRKFYRRYIDPDLLVEAIFTRDSSQPGRPSPTSASSSAPNEQTKSQKYGSASRASGNIRTSVSNSSSLTLHEQSIQFSVNVWVLLVGILAAFPLVPQTLSVKAYQLSFIGMGCSTLYSLYSLHGKPRIWNFQELQIWLQSIIVTKDFLCVIYCLTFITSHLCLKYALVPIFCQAIVHISKFLSHNCCGLSLYRKFLEKPCSLVDLNTTKLSILSSQAEIVLGFLLIVSLFSWQRNIIHTFMYWQLLKLMYHTPATSVYHQSVWANVERSLNSHVYRYAPFLRTPVSAIQRWWLRA